MLALHHSPILGPWQRLLVRQQTTSERRRFVGIVRVVEYSVIERLQETTMTSLKALRRKPSKAKSDVVSSLLKIDWQKVFEKLFDVTQELQTIAKVAADYRVRALLQFV